MSRELDNEKSASGTFANSVLRDGKDSAFLIHFDREVELLRDLTSSREKFVSALQLLQSTGLEDRQQNGGNSGGNSGGGYPGGRGRGGSGGGARRGGTHLYDSIYLASDEVLAKQEGRKAIIVLTDGEDRGSKETLDEAIESAQRSNTMVYAIYYEGEQEHRHSDFGGPMGGGRHGGGWPGGGGGYPGGGRSPRSTEPTADGKKVLERLAQETGGRMFKVSKKEPIEQIYATIQDELRNQYNLGYTPDRKNDNAADYRHIKVTVKKKDYNVQAREGYYASRQDTGKPGN
jgi:VWFA-related protein